MTLLRLSALSAALVMSSSVQANFLTEEGSLDLHLRNYFMDNSNELSGNKLKAHQWAQAFSVNYSSGYFHNIVGVDLGGHYALKLKADSDLNAANPGLLPIDNNGKSSSYGKNSYAIKVNLMDMGVAKYGRIFLDTPLMNENYSRSLPSLTEGFYADGNFAGANLYGIWAIKANHRTESGFDNLMVNGNKKPVKVVGGGYDFDNGLEAHLAVGQQSDYATRYYGDVTYSTELQGAIVSGDFKYGNNKRIGFSKTDGQDNSQNTWGVSVKADIHQASVGVSYQKVSQSDIGEYKTLWSGQEMISGDMTGYFGPHDLMVSSFTNNGEKSWGVNAGYDFAGLVDGLSVSAIYVKGTTDPKNGNNDADESEYNLVAVYALPQVENLRLSALYGKNTKKDKGTGNKETNSQLRLIAKYDMSVF